MADRSPFLDRQGAVVLDDAVDAGVPSHYGEPVAEQRRLAAGDAVVDLSSLDVVEVAGPDRRSWLHSLTSQDVASLAPGESAETLMLDQQGRIQFAVRLVDDGSSAWAIVDGGAGAGLAAWLSSMVFMLRVEVRERPDVRVLAALSDGALGDLHGPAGAAPLRWRDPWPAVALGGHQYAAAAGHPADGFPLRLALTDADGLAAVAASGVPAAGSLALEALRIAAWRPRAATEVDDRALPHEFDWLRSAVHLTKGCYRGQETVAKVHNLGHPPRRLALLQLDGSGASLPERGALIVVGGANPEKPVGIVTAAARHHELGPIALALLRRAAPEDAALVVDPDGERIDAAQEVIVPASAGAAAGVPRVPRLGAPRRD